MDLLRVQLMELRLAQQMVLQMAPQKEWQTVQQME
jgi:hypothetical protein